jgi:hypothetical protein
VSNLLENTSTFSHFTLFSVPLLSESELTKEIKKSEKEEKKRKQDLEYMDKRK